jgi:hypothetical protein
MTIIPQCFNCKNFIGQNDQGGYKCKAFDNIPVDILVNKIWHDKPLKKLGQENKITFEPEPVEKQ